MRSKICLVVVLVATSFSQLFADITDAPPVTDDWTWIPGVGSFEAVGSSAEGKSSLSMDVTLDPSNKFRVTRWEFYTDPTDTSKWTARYHADGWIGAPQTPFDEWHQTSDFSYNGVTLHKGLGMWWMSGEDDILRPESWGDLELSSLKFDSSSVTYQALPVIIPGEMPHEMWMLDYETHGEFIAPTFAQAQTMGVSFVQVPEPSSICMLLGIAIFGGVIIWRKKR